MTYLTLIISTSKNNILSIDGKRPWSTPRAEIERFEKEIKGHPLIMDELAYKSFSTNKISLDGMTKILISGQESKSFEDIIRCGSLEEALDIAKMDTLKIFVMGGKNVCEGVMDKATEIMLTRVYQSYSKTPDNTTIFSQPDSSIWEEETHKSYRDHTFIRYKRRKT